VSFQLHKSELLAYNYHNSGEIYQMVPLYVLATKIYHFLAKFFQIRQITNLHLIDSETDRWTPFVSADVAKTRGYLLTRTRSHMSVHLKK
jgi:hypothetical protein